MSVNNHSILLINGDFFKHDQNTLNTLNTKKIKPFQELTEDYRKILSSSEDRANFLKNLTSNKDNEKLFYSGLEKEFDNKLNEKHDLVKSRLEKLFNFLDSKKGFQSKPDLVKNIKTYLRHKNNVLLSIWVPLKLDLDEPFTIDFVFPIDYVAHGK